MKRALPRLTTARAVLILAALVVGYFIFAAVDDALLSRELNQDEERIQNEIRDLQRQQADLEVLRDYLQTEEYIERVARRVLGLVRPGETLIIVSTDATPAAPAGAEEDAATDGEPRPWWEELYLP